MPLSQLLLCTVISSALALQGQTHEKTVPEIVKGASDAVVLIVAADSSGKETTLGSGFIVSADGRIVTNLHVIRGSNSAIAKMANGAFFLVDGLLGVDDQNDLALLKVNGKNLPHLSLSAARPDIGEHVVAIGSPLGIQNTVSDGIVSGIRDVSPAQSVIQTTAPISHGNSGGPLLNSEGQVIGVITAYLSEGQNLNLAIPSQQVEALLGRSGALVPLDAASNRQVVQDQKNIVTQPQPPAQPEKHRGVWVAGHGSAEFGGIYVEVLDVLGSGGVKIANSGLQKVAETKDTGFIPLSELIELLPKTGADSLLYVKVEPALSLGKPTATVDFQLFDATGRLLWEEKATDVLANGGNTIFHPKGWKSRLVRHIGQPGLVLKQSQVEGSVESKK